MNQLSRRNFLKAGVAASALASVPLHAEKQTATSLVALGKSDVKVTRLALGTGSFSGRIQQQLGQEGLTRLVHYAYDRGIRFFETAESYGDSQRMLAVALKGIPRESYVLMTKVTTDDGVDPNARLDQLRKNSDTDYFDIMLLHWQHTGNWMASTAHWQDGMIAAQEKKLILSRGASVHGLPALRQVPGNKFLQVAMIRMNHNGTRMDGAVPDDGNLGDVAEVVTHVKQVKKDGMGVISMKLCGDGTFTRHEDRVAAMRFAMRNAGVDCVTVGFKNTQEVDEAIDNLNLALS